jgi:demethylmenaquinone methyltransferase/2-methoxy-6-polyprenyl-1,4-benzoquinol methylase
MSVLPYKDQKSSKKEQVAQMFDNISGHYDLLNRVLSLGIDQFWRKTALKYLKKEKPNLILDVATGTADFAIAGLQTGAQKVIGVDIAEKMLEIGRQKIKVKKIDSQIELLKGDSEALNFADQTFDAATVAFGVRNFENLEKGLSEICRVLKPNALLVILEFSKPKTFPFKQGYWFYSSYILPLVGRMISSDRSAYNYLPESVKAFPERSALCQIISNCGFSSVNYKPLTFGVCCIYLARK